MCFQLRVEIQQHELRVRESILKRLAGMPLFHPPKITEPKLKMWNGIQNGIHFLTV